MKSFAIIAVIVAAMLISPVMAYGTCSDWTETSYYDNYPNITTHRHYGEYDNYTWSYWYAPLPGGAEIKNGGSTDEDAAIHSIVFWPNVTAGKYIRLEAVNKTLGCSIKRELFYTSSQTPFPTSDFTATPLSGSAPLYVMFDDASLNITDSATYNWSTTGSGVLWDNTSSPTPGVMFITPGNFTISHGVSTEYGSNITTKTDYITVYNGTTDYVTTNFVIMDEPRWVQLAGASINMLDVENGTWKNVSSSATGYENITTLSDHTVSAYASMLGYNDDELLNQPAWAGGDYRLLMFPENYGNVSAGNVTVYVSVYDTDLSSNEGRVADAAVNMAYSSGGDQVNDYKITDDAGMVSFVVPNQTTIYLYAEKAGYTRGGTTISSGNGNGGSAAVYAEITIGRTLATTAPTVTTLPGGGTPAPTVDPYPCDADHPENCKRKQTEMGNTLIQYGPQLLLLFIIATFVGVIKMMGK